MLLRYSMITTVAICVIFGFKIWTQDIYQAFLQSAFKLIYKIYLKPSNEVKKYIEIISRHPLKLLRPLYGLSDSGDYWDFTLSDRIRNDLGMTATAEQM